MHHKYIYIYIYIFIFLFVLFSGSDEDLLLMTTPPRPAKQSVNPRGGAALLSDCLGKELDNYLTGSPAVGRGVDVDMRDMNVGHTSFSLQSMRCCFN